MFIVNNDWMKEALLKEKREDGNEYLEYVLNGCQEDDRFVSSLADLSLGLGQYDSDDLLQALLGRTCIVGHIQDIAMDILQGQISEFIKDDLLQHKYLVYIGDRVWLFEEHHLSEFEVEDIELYMEENGIVSGRKKPYKEEEYLYLYRIDHEYYKDTKIITGNVILTQIKEVLVQY